MRGNLLCISRLRCADSFARNLERRQIPFRELGRNAAARQQSVKFRMRQIEIVRDLFELGAADSSQPAPTHSSDEAPHPADKTAARL